MRHLTEVLREYGVDFKTAGEHRHVSQNWVGIDCPFCGRDSKKYHMGIHLVGLYSNCWRCGPHPIVLTLASLLGCPFTEARRIRSEISPEVGETREVSGAFEEPPGLGPLTSPHRRYLERRGFDPDEVSRLWDLQGIGVTGESLRWRIWIPILYRDRPVSWTARAIGDGVEPRYINARAEQEAIPAREVLYGIDYCRSTVIVCEGPTDVWRVGPGAVATMGVGISPEQVALISRFPRRLICFDSDRPGQARARRLMRDLEPLEGATFNVVLDAKDPGSADPAEIRDLRREAFGEEDQDR